MRTGIWKALTIGAMAGLAGLLCVGATQAGQEAKSLSQNLAKGEGLTITRATDALPARVRQAGRLTPYRDDPSALGLQFRTGSEITVDTDIVPANSVASTLVGVAGKGTHVRYTGRWEGDASGGFPILVLRDHGKMTWEAGSEVDFVMASNFFTRQLWVDGDGTGVLELAEGFISDRTKDATVPNAMGTIRLGGATLITHHSHSLPYNSRPDGRGGIYHNGHVVFENKAGSKWIVRTNQHIYSAQIDFAIDGEIVCEAPLTHNGQRRVCLPVGNGGHFVSTGAFRTTSPNVTITKSGPAMLSLEGQQSFEPGSRLVVAEGLLRLVTDPGAGKRVSGSAGAFLTIVVEKGGSLHVAAPVARLASIELRPGAKMSIEEDCKVEIAGELTVQPGAELTGADRVEGKVVGQQ